MNHLIAFFVGATAGILVTSLMVAAKRVPIADASFYTNTGDQNGSKALADVGTPGRCNGERRNGVCRGDGAI